MLSTKKHPLFFKDFTTVSSFFGRLRRNEDTRGETEKAEKEGKGGGVAECHPVIRDSVLLVHRAQCLNRERNSG